MPSGASVFQASNPGINVARSTQTTVPQVSPNAPFNRQSRKQQQQGFVVSGQAFGALITQQLPAAGGYLSGLSLTVTATGGVNGTHTVALQPDAPWNVLGNQVQLKDATGNPVINIDSYSLYLVNLFSGQTGQAGQQDPSSTPTYSAVSTGASGTGNFTLRLIVPLQLDSSGYCSLSDQNATAQPTFQTSLATSAQFYSTAPGTLPTMAIQCNLLYWGIPAGNPLAAPPDNGSSAQWTISTAGQNPSASASVRARHPSPGTFVHTMLIVLRDNTNARVNAFPTTDLALWVDDFPVKNSMLLSELQDEVWKQFHLSCATSDGGFAANEANTAGVIVFSFRTSVMAQVSAADTYDEILLTTPSTKLEVGGTWGSAGTAPYSVNFLTGWLYPANAQRIPWTHLAN
jgi:hypothetical protein